MDLVRCSQFAKMCGTTRDTLLHYEHLGLLKPFFIDPQNNYRYYSVTQFNRFASIKALVDAGLSLETTKQLLDEQSPQDMLAAIEEGRESLRCRIDELKKSQTLLQVMERQLEFAEEIPEGEPVVRHLNSQLAMEVPGYPRATITDYVADPVLNQLYVEAFLNLRDLSPCAWLAPYGVISQGPVDCPVKYEGLFFLIQDKRDAKHLQIIMEIPAGDYALIGFRGPWDNVTPAHVRLMDYVRRLGYNENVPRFEISSFRLFDTDSSNGMNDYRCIVFMRLEN